MARLFSDGFDTYASTSDVVTAWGSGGAGGQDTIVTAANTAFGTGLALSLSVSTAGAYQAAWASNEGTVFFSLRYKIPTGSSSTNYVSFGFTDAGTRQLSIRFNMDGSIGIYSGGPTGTLLGTVAAGTIAVGAWNSLQGQVVFNNTTGSVTLRLNGSTSALLTLTNVNTRGGTTNAYANGHSLLGPNGATGSVQFDDLFINSASGAAPTSWPGDLRAVQQTPAAATQAQFAPGGTALSATVQTTTITTNLGAMSANVLTFFGKYTTSHIGTCAGITVYMAAALTGHLGVALYDATGVGGAPGNLLGFVTFTNPTIGFNTVNFGSPLTLPVGSYYFATLADASYTAGGSAVNVSSGNTSLAYAAGFPATTSVSVSSGFVSAANMAFTLITSNLGCIQDATEDGDATYISSGTVGQEDIYTLTSVPTTYSVVGVEYYVWWKKSDAGARTAQLSVQANGSADTAEITNAALGNSYAYSTKFLATDPTGAGWTPTTANGAKIGISVTA